MYSHELININYFRDNIHNRNLNILYFYHIILIEIDFKAIIRLFIKINMT